jgi:hypothetical protein
VQVQVQVQVECRAGATRCLTVWKSVAKSSVHFAVPHTVQGFHSGIV